MNSNFVKLFLTEIVADIVRGDERFFAANHPERIEVTILGRTCKGVRVRASYDGMSFDSFVSYKQICAPLGYDF